MEKYKLKAEARQFFDEDLGKEIKPLDWWRKEQIPHQLLETMPSVHVTYGIEESESHTSLKSWDSKDGGIAKLHFTLVAPMCHDTYKRVNIPVIMDKIQSVVDNYWKNEYQ